MSLTRTARSDSFSLVLAERVELECDDDVFPDQPADQLVCVSGDAIDFEDLRFQELLPGEGQQLTRERGCSLGASLDPCHVALHDIVRSRVRLEEVRVAADGRQHVESVRPSFELADRLYLFD